MNLMFLLSQYPLNYGCLIRGGPMGCFLREEEIPFSPPHKPPPAGACFKDGTVQVRPERISITAENFPVLVLTQLNVNDLDD